MAAETHLLGGSLCPRTDPPLEAAGARAGAERGEPRVPAPPVRPASFVGQQQDQGGLVVAMVAYGRRPWQRYLGTPCVERARSVSFRLVMPICPG